MIEDFNWQFIVGVTWPESLISLFSLSPSHIMGLLFSKLWSLFTNEGEDKCIYSLVKLDCKALFFVNKLKDCHANRTTK